MADVRLGGGGAAPRSTLLSSVGHWKPAFESCPDGEVET
jgi:hypothetical protein